MSITLAQIRGARGLLNWSQNELASRTGISDTSIGAIEKGQTTPRASTMETIRSTFERNGIEFIPGEGVRKKNPQVEILKDVEGFKKFSYDVHETAQNDDREILQAYVDDKEFAKWLGAEALPHVQRIESVNKSRFKILQKENDVYFPAKNYAEYKWIPEKQFMAVPFIVYGDNFAIILYEPEPTIIVTNFPTLAQAYRLQFNTIWEQAITPSKNLIDNWEMPEIYLNKKTV